MNLKYLIVSQDDLEVPLVFSPLLLHEQVAEKCRVISAGFCGWDDTGKWIAGGRSASLALSARPQDAGILNTHLGAGGSPNPAAGHAAPARFCFDGQSGAKPESHFVKTQNPPTVRPQ